MNRMRIGGVDLASGDLFQLLLDHFPDIIHSIDENGNILYTNKSAERILGYTAKEMLSLNIADIYAPDVLPAVEQGFRDLKESGCKAVESVLVARDRTRIPVEIRSFAIYDDDGHFLRTFSILRDIREIKDLQRGLVHAGRLAAIGELASGIAHDIKNPLMVILLCVQMVLRETEEAESSLSLDDSVHEDNPMLRIRARAKDLRKAATSIQKLADHLRGFSRGISDSIETVDLHTSITDALFIMDNRIQTCGITVECPVSPKAHYVLGSGSPLEQVFVNLFSNACDAMLECGERSLRVSVTACEEGRVPCWRCDVTDTGVGIAPAARSRVFESFFTTKEKGRGTGLGLSICRGIIRDHKGEITFASEPGTGTTFSVFLPRGTAPSQSDSPEAE